MSILSETNPIQHWLNTPIGYYPHDREYGNNLHILLFKNDTVIKLLLNDILDKIREDLGDTVVNSVDEIFTATVDDIDKKIVVIRYKKDKFAFGVVE